MQPSANIPSIWKAQVPDSWPEPLTKMSFTQLKEIEGCSRKWSLQNAQYPTIQDMPRYPRKPSINLLRGRIVHGALEHLVNKLSEAGDFNPDSEQAITAILELGGFRSLINSEATKQIDLLLNNPRFTDKIDLVKSELSRNLIDMVNDMKDLVSRLPNDQPNGVVNKGQTGYAGANHGDLPFGVHSEVRLQPATLNWTGVADLIYFSPDTCEIWDFKTGERNDTYAEQLRTYAMLWYFDDSLNPEGRTVDRLVLAYPEGEVEVPAPTLHEIQALHAELLSRTENAITSLRKSPPPAQPDWAQCQWCEVKQLCDVYWHPGTQIEFAKYQDPANNFVDIELMLNEKSGIRSYRATVKSCTSSRIRPGTTIVFTMNQTDAFETEGDIIRVLGALLKIETEELSEEEIPTITTTKWSERFFLTATN